MSIANRVQHYIDTEHRRWNAVVHKESLTSLQAAHFAHVDPRRTAKAVLLWDAAGFVLAVGPADREVDVEEVNETLGGRKLRFAPERELGLVFLDCSPGALPPFGALYGVATVWDPALAANDEVYFEGGDHHTLVRMSGRDFGGLMGAARPLRRHLT